MVEAFKGSVLYSINKWQTVGQWESVKSTLEKSVILIFYLFYLTILYSCKNNKMFSLTCTPSPYLPNTSSNNYDDLLRKHYCSHASFFGLSSGPLPSLAYFKQT